MNFYECNTVIVYRFADYVSIHCDSNCQKSICVSYFNKMLILLIERQKCSGQELTLKNYIYAQFFLWSPFIDQNLCLMAVLCDGTYVLRFTLYVLYITSMHMWMSLTSEFCLKFIMYIYIYLWPLISWSLRYYFIAKNVSIFL